MDKNLWDFLDKIEGREDSSYDNVKKEIELQQGRPKKEGD